MASNSLEIQEDSALTSQNAIIKNKQGQHEKLLLGLNMREEGGLKREAPQKYDMEGESLTPALSEEEGSIRIFFQR